MIVCRSKTFVSVRIRCPEGYEHLYEIMDKAEALALEKQWKEEKEKEAERKASEQPEGESPEQPHP